MRRIQHNADYEIVRRGYCMVYVMFFDGGFVVVLLFLFIALVGGTAYGIVDFMKRNLPTVITICVCVMGLIFLLSYFTTKKWRTSFLSIIYSSQFCFFVTYGIYKLGKLYSEHPILCVLLFFCYAMYGIFNALGLMLPVANIGESKETEICWGMRIGDLGMLALGVVGWIVNWIVL